MFSKGYSENLADFIGKSRRKRHMFVSCLRSDGWLTSEDENGQARPLLYRNFLFNDEAKYAYDQIVTTI